MKNILVIPACFLVFLLRCGQSQQLVSYVKVGDTVPSFSATTLDGKTIGANTFKGKVVLLNFWATWCAPCREEMPRLEKEIWEKYKGSDNFEMIAIGREETDASIGEYRKKLRYSFPMAPDPQRAIYSKFANAGIPRNYVIGPDGKIIYASVGYVPRDFEKMARIISMELGKLDAFRLPNKERTMDRESMNLSYRGGAPINH
jgi:peroxiredoxin